MRKRMLVFLTITGLLVVGCGGKDDAATTAQESSDAALAESTSGSADSTSGSGGSESSTSTNENGTIAKPVFVKKANAICDKTVERITAVGFPEFEKTYDRSAEERAKIESRIASTILAPELLLEVEQIQALGIPRGDEIEVGAILRAILKVIEEAKENPKNVIGSSNIFQESSSLAGRYGLGSCPYG